MAALEGLTQRTDEALADTRLRAAVRNVTTGMTDKRQNALDQLENADELRDAARTVRAGIVGRLPEILEQWSDNFEANGGTVHWARDADEAVAAALAITRRHGSQRVVKGKSMASEEIHLNAAFEADGLQVIETDLGEFIIQLAGETPSHLIAPAIHKDRHDVAELFTEDAGQPVGPDIQDEAAYARRRLRSAFIAADVGVTGVNFAVAETGSIALVENEGNGRMCTSLPKVHIAIMGMERIVETWEQLDLMLSLLARSATGQPLTVYNNILSGPRRPGEADGPEELHVIVIDNGRSNLLGTEFVEALNCIRCGACLNTCPVYRHIGGHAYNSVYSGPIGAVLTPLLHPQDQGARDLAEASSLCGSCWDVCPVRIPLHDMLLGIRRRDAKQDAGPVRRLGFGMWSRLWGTRTGFDATRKATPAAMRVLGDRDEGPGWVGGWARGRALPVIPSQSLEQQLRDRP